jgi:hypothetical protein
MDYLILFYEMKDCWKTYKAIIWLKEILLEVEQAMDLTLLDSDVITFLAIGICLSFYIYLLYNMSFLLQSSIEVLG